METCGRRAEIEGTCTTTRKNNAPDGLCTDSDGRRGRVKAALLTVQFAGSRARAWSAARAASSAAPVGDRADASNGRPAGRGLRIEVDSVPDPSLQQPTASADGSGSS